MSDEKINTLNWSDEVYTLSDLAEKLKLNCCLVKSNELICSELDFFEVLCFKNIYCVRAFKVSIPADMDMKEDKRNNNMDHHTLTSGEEVFIPMHYTGRGSVIPLYGESHVCNTVEELIMTFPRYVLIEEDLKICSESKIIQLQAGSELELLRNTKDKNYQNKLICRYGAQTLQLNPSDIGRFRVRPDPNLYSVKDILQRLKLPQIIDFKEMIQDHWEKEGNFFEGLAPEQSYTGKFLLTGLFKDKVAVAVYLGPNCRPNSQPFLLPLSSDLLQQLMFRFAFRGDCSQIHFKGRNNSLTELDNSKNQKKTPRKKEAKLKRGKSEAVENAFTNPEEDQLDMFSGDEDISQNQQIPFELTYTQYRFPQSTNKCPNQGDNIFKKVQSVLKTVKGKFKKASSKDVAAIQDNVPNVSTPEPVRSASNKLYPILANLMNEDSSIYAYIESGTVGKKSGTVDKKSGQRQSQFYFEIEPPKIASAPTEEYLTSEMPLKENVYQNLDDILIETRNNGEGAESEELGKEPAENQAEARPATRAETETETEVYATLYAEDDGNETEKDIGSLVDAEEHNYMNYNQMATLQIRRSSPSGKRSTSCVSDYSSSEEVSQDSNWNMPTSIPQRATDEKSDFSTEEERSFTESGSSLNTDLDYEFEVRGVIPNKVFPVPAKRNSIFSSKVAAVDGSSESSSDASSDMNPGVGTGDRKQTTTPLEGMSVIELCEILQQCGLGSISELCQEHSLDGAFICALPTDSLQELPFSLSPLEVMKLSMMKKGWKPKMK